MGQAAGCCGARRAAPMAPSALSAPQSSTAARAEAWERRIERDKAEGTASGKVTSDATHTASTPPPPRPAAPPAAKATEAAGGARCERCGERAYASESVQFDGRVYHHRCFRCARCDAALSLQGVAVADGALLCKNCFKSLFRATGGRYDRVAAALGGGGGGGGSGGAEATGGEGEGAGEGAPQEARSLRERAAAYSAEASGVRQRAEYEAGLAARRASEFAAAPRLDAASLAAARSTIASTLEKQQAAALTAAAGASADDPAGGFAEALAAAVTGGELNLNNTQFFMRGSPEQIAARRQAVLERLRAGDIARLSASSANLGDEFAAELAALLAEGAHALEEINLENNRIGPAGVAALCDALARDSRVRVVKLFANPLATASAEAVARLVDPKNPARNATLTKLTYECKLAQHRDALEAGLRRNWALAKGRAGP
jgi:hypothetical protein